MRNTLGALALLSVVLLGSGCKKSSPLVGKWAPQGGGNVTFEFKPDNTFAVGMKAGPYQLTSKGDYKLAGENLTLNTKDIEAPGASPAILAQAKASPSFTQPKQMKVKFTSDDELSISSGAGTDALPATTLTRVKG